MQKFNVQKFHTFYAKMMIFFNGDGFKLGRLEKRVPNLLHTLFMKVHEIYFKEYHCKVEGMKLDLKNALLTRHQNKQITVLGISAACICANVF